VPRAVKVASVVAALLLAAGAGLFLAYRAAQSVPEFYRAAITVPSEDQVVARDAFVARATALAGDLSAAGHWQSLFAADEINAWLALELARDYPEIVSGELRDPRIAISAGEATIACRYDNGSVSSVVSLSFEAFVQEPNVIGLRILRARAGALPIPLGQVLDNISLAARELNLRLEWRRWHGDPVALVTLPQQQGSGQAPWHLESLELREGELFVSGTVGKQKLDASPIVPEPLRVPTAEKEPPRSDQPVVGAAEKETRQK
jgi:hypothetical protein